MQITGAAAVGADGQSSREMRSRASESVHKQVRYFFLGHVTIAPSIFEYFILLTLPAVRRRRTKLDSRLRGTDDSRTFGDNSSIFHTVRASISLWTTPWSNPCAPTDR